MKEIKITLDDAGTLVGTSSEATVDDIMLMVGKWLGGLSADVTKGTTIYEPHMRRSIASSLLTNMGIDPYKFADYIINTTQPKGDE